MSLTPHIGSAGIFTLLAPFQAQLRSGVSYTCVAIRRMADILALGIDPYEKYYVPNGLSKANFDAALQANEAIVSLQSTSGHWVYVPTTHIQSYPNMGGIPYTSLILAADIGAVPNYLDLSSVKTRIRDAIRDSLGVTTEVKHVAISEQKAISQSDHNAIEAARVASVTDTKTDYAKYQEERTLRLALQQKVTELEAYIQANLAP